MTGALDPFTLFTLCTKNKACAAFAWQSLKATHAHEIDNKLQAVGNAIRFSMAQKLNRRPDDVSQCLDNALLVRTNVFWGTSHDRRGPWQLWTPSRASFADFAVAAILGPAEKDAEFELRDAGPNQKVATFAQDFQRLMEAIANCTSIADLKSPTAPQYTAALLQLATKHPRQMSIILQAFLNRTRQPEASEPATAGRLTALGSTFVAAATNNPVSPTLATLWKAL